MGVGLRMHARYSALSTVHITKATHVQPGYRLVSNECDTRSLMWPSRMGDSRVFHNSSWGIQHSFGCEVLESYMCAASPGTTLFEGFESLKSTIVLACIGLPLCCLSCLYAPVPIPRTSPTHAYSTAFATLEHRPS